MSWMITGAIVMGGLTANSIKQQNEAIADQQDSIAATTRMNYALKQQQEQELKEQAGMELTGEAIKRFQERGSIKAAQGESGVAGASPLRELSNTYLQESLTAGTIIAKSEAGQRSLALENQSTYLQGLSQINQLENQFTTGFDAALQIGISAGAGALMGGAAAGSFGTGAAATTASTSAATTAGTSTTAGSLIQAAVNPMTLGTASTTAASGGLFAGLTNATAFQAGMGLYSSKSMFGKQQ